jgi:pyridoxine 5-phosphate synthase
MTEWNTPANTGGDVTPKLGVNVDHVATVREARGTQYPEPIDAAQRAEMAGADQITVHLREDRRHIQDRDVELLREVVQTRLNLEMAATGEMLDIAKRIQPDMVTLVPERRDEQTTEGGLDVVGQSDELTGYLGRLRESGAVTSLFIDPNEEQIDAAAELDVELVELHTGDYAEAASELVNTEGQARASKQDELRRLERAASHAAETDLIVAAGHGLNYRNIGPVAAIEAFEEFNIGHSIVSRAVLTGFEEAVREMKELLK